MLHVYLTVPAARNPLHHLLPFSWFTRKTTDGLWNGSIPSRPLHLLQLQTPRKKDRGIQPHKERQNTKTQQEYFHVHSYIESQIVGPLADDMVARVAVIGHLKLEDVVASRSVPVLVEQNTCTSTSCETDRSRHL